MDQKKKDKELTSKQLQTVTGGIENYEERWKKRGLKPAYQTTPVKGGNGGFILPPREPKGTKGPKS